MKCTLSFEGDLNRATIENPFAGPITFEMDCCKFNGLPEGDYKQLGKIKITIDFPNICHGRRLE